MDVYAEKRRRHGEEASGSPSDPAQWVAAMAEDGQDLDLETVADWQMRLGLHLDELPLCALELMRHSERATKVSGLYTGIQATATLFGSLYRKHQNCSLPIFCSILGDYRS